jgi:hypothetical protein
MLPPKLTEPPELMVPPVFGAPPSARELVCVDPHPAVDGCDEG